MDNMAALERAWDLAAAEPNSAILWICGPQPMIVDAEALLQRFQRRSDGPRLFAFQVKDGPNEVLDALERVPAVAVVPRVETPEEDFERFIAGWQASAKRQMTLERMRAPKRQASGKETSRHLVRLWARDGAMRRYYRNTPADTEMAIAMASKYCLVTPVSGAVVLETAEQYKANGLEPTRGDAVPVVPEPEEWMMLIAGMLLIAVLFWRKRATARAVS